MRWVCPSPGVRSPAGLERLLGWWRQRGKTPQPFPSPGVPTPPPRYASADLEPKASWENSLELQRRPQRNAGSSRGKARGLHSLSAFHQLYSPAREKGWGPALMKTGARKKGRREFQMEKQRNEPESGAWSSSPSVPLLSGLMYFPSFIIFFWLFISYSML